MTVDWRYVGKKIRRVFLGAVLIYLSVAAILFVFQRHFIYPNYMRDAPASGGEGIAGLQRLWRDIGDDDKPVEAWLLPGKGVSAERPGPLLVFTHGNAELIDDWPSSLEQYRLWGFNVLLPEYRGYGRSGGSPAQDEITEDLIWFLDQVIERPEVDGQRLVYHGRSLGGGAACALAAARPPKALILQSTFARLADLASRFFMPSILVFDEWDNESVLPQLACPVLIMHGTHDRLIPFSHAERLVQAAKRAKLVKQDCRHADCPPDYVEQWYAVDEFLHQAEIR